MRRSTTGMVRDATEEASYPSRRGDGRLVDAVRYDQKVVLVQLRREGVVFRLEPQNECFEFRDTPPQSLIVFEEAMVAADKSHESLGHECASFKVGRCSYPTGTERLAKSASGSN